MGNIAKRYCDWNGEPLNGVGFRLAIQDTSGPAPLTVVDMDLCGGCYTLLSGYMTARKSVVETAWRIDPKAIVPKTPE